MTVSPSPSPAKMGRRLVLAGAGTALALLIAANGHLVYVALSSQPACVPHAKVPQASTAGESVFRAARPSC